MVRPCDLMTKYNTGLLRGLSLWMITQALMFELYPESRNNECKYFSLYKSLSIH